MHRFARIAATVITIGGLALVASGCGNAAKTTASTPSASPSTSAKAHQSSGLTLTEASSIDYKVKFPLVACSTLSASAQADWVPYLAGSRVGDCAPADYIAKDVPSVLTVIDDDPAISQSEANAYGRALMVTFAWTNWAAYDDAPQLTLAVGQGAGPDEPYYQMLVSGYIGTGSVPGSAAYPNSITLIPLDSSAQTEMDNTSDKFALVVSYPQHGYSVTGTYPGEDPVTTQAPPQTPAIYTGSILTSPILGTYFGVNIFSNNCSIGPAEPLCDSVGG